MYRHQRSYFVPTFSQLLFYINSQSTEHRNISFTYSHQNIQVSRNCRCKYWVQINSLGVIVLDSSRFTVPGLISCASVLVLEEKGKIHISYQIPFVVIVDLFCVNIFSLIKSVIYIFCFFLTAITSSMLDLTPWKEESICISCRQYMRSKV